MRFEVGQHVGIVGNIPFALKERRRVRGIITRIDGDYIFVRPLWCKWETELYACELVHEWDVRY